MKFSIIVDGTTFKKTNCRHFYINNRRFCKRGFNQHLIWAAIRQTNRFKPYVTVVHIATNKAFQLTRGYRLVPTEKMKMVDAIVSDWKGWAPTDNNQRPQWAQGLPDSEFHAYWHKG